MIDMTYDPEADAVYVLLAHAKVDRTEEAGPFIYDLDAEGRISGIEILSANKVLAPGIGRMRGGPALKALMPPNSERGITKALPRE